MAEELPDWARDSSDDTLPDWARDTGAPDTTSGAAPSTPATDDALSEPLTYETFGPTPQLPSVIKAANWARRKAAVGNFLRNAAVSGAGFPADAQAARNKDSWIENAYQVGVEVAKGMVQPPTAEDIFFQSGGLFGPQAQTIYRGAKAYAENKPPEEVARTLSPEYGHIQAMREHPIGSKEWFQGAIPLGIEAAQYLPVLGAALRLPPVRARGPEFRFPITEKPGGIPPAAGPEPVPASGAPGPEPVPGAAAAEAPAPTTPAKFAPGDVVDAQDINSRIVDAQEMPEGNWKVLLDNAQYAVLQPVDETGASLKVAQVGMRGTLEGEAIRTGESVKSQQARAEERAIEARTTQEEMISARYKERPSAGLTDYEQDRIKTALATRKATIEAADRLQATDPTAAAQMRREAVRQYTQDLNQIYRPKKGGEPNAIEPSNAQVQRGETTLGQQARADGTIPKPGDSDYVVGETQGTEARGNVPGAEPEPTGEPVVTTAPEANAPGIEPLEPYKKPPNPGDRVIWRNQNLTVTSVNPKTNVVHFEGGGHAPFNPKRMKRPRPPLLDEAIHNVNRRLALPRDRTLLAQGQEKGVYPSNKELKTLYENEHEALSSKYGTEEPPATGPPERKVLASANKAAFEGGTPEQNAAIARGVKEGPGPQGFWAGPQQDIEAHMDVLAGGEQQLPSGKLIKEPVEPGLAKDVVKESAKEGGKRGAEAIPEGERITAPTHLVGEPPPIPPEYLQPRPPPPLPQTQARMGATVEKAFNDLHGTGVITENDPLKGLGKTEVIDAGRAAIRAGVNPEAAANSNFLRPDYKYAVMRAHAEDLRLRAIEADRKAKLDPSAANKADAEDAFREYSNWDGRTTEAGQAADGWLAAKGAIDPITDEPDIRSMVDAREQFLRLNKREMTPSETRQAEKQVLNVQKATLERNAAADKYSEDLRKASPEMHDEIKNKDDLERVTDKMWDRKFPCT